MNIIKKILRLFFKADIGELCKAPPNEAAMPKLGDKRKDVQTVDVQVKLDMSEAEACMKRIQELQYAVDEFKKSVASITVHVDVEN